MKLKFFPNLVVAIAFRSALCAIAAIPNPLLAQDSTSSPDRVTSPTLPPKPRVY